MGAVTAGALNLNQALMSYVFCMCAACRSAVPRCSKLLYCFLASFFWRSYSMQLPRRRCYPNSLEPTAVAKNDVF